MDRKTELLKKKFFDYIHEQDLKVGERLPTEAELSEIFGLSRTTVRGAFATLEREGVIQRRRGAGTFLSQLNRNSSNIIAVMIPAFFHQLEIQGANDRIVEGIEHRAFANKCSVILCRTGNRRDKVEEYILQLRNNNIAGLIYTPLNTSNSHYDNLEILARFESEHIPYVVIDSFISNGSTGRYSFVGCDNYKIMRDMTRYVIDKGYHRIAFIRGFPGIYTSDERFFGFRDEMQKAGLPIREEYLRIMTETELDHQGEKEIAELLSLSQPPDVVLCPHDIVAVNVIRYMQARGLEVPKDMAVAGFDDLPRAQMLIPRLTTVRQPFTEIGAMAAEILFDKLSGKQKGERQEFIRCKLIERESC